MKNIKILYLVIFIISISCNSQEENSTEITTELIREHLDKMLIEEVDYKYVLPANWIIDTETPDYDPKEQFSIGNPNIEGGLTFSFLLENEQMEAVDWTGLLFNLVITDKNIQRFTEKKTFKKWGKYDGFGIISTATFTNKDVREVRIFSCNTEKGSFAVVEIKPNEIKNEFKIVELSFTLK